MLRAERHASADETPSDWLTLAYDERKRSRLRARTESGAEVAIVLARGTALKHGDRLKTETGEVLGVRAAPENVAEARTHDPLLLTRAAYHLGNRHVPLQIEAGVLRFQFDHVLGEMVADLGLKVVQALAPFEPEGGAYAHLHAHAHPHAHPHEHEYTHARHTLSRPTR